MRHTQTSINKATVDRYNSVPEYRFSMRGQTYSFPTRDEYLEAFGNAMELADKQQRQIETPDEDFDVEEALRDSDTQMTFDFENRDPEDRKFSDDVDPAHR